MSETPEGRRLIEESLREVEAEWRRSGASETPMLTPDQISELLDDARACNCAGTAMGDQAAIGHLIALLEGVLPDLVMQVMARQELERLSRVIEHAERETEQPGCVVCHKYGGPHPHEIKIGSTDG
jgi:hypothetical protein